MRSASAARSSKASRTGLPGLPGFGSRCAQNCSMYWAAWASSFSARKVLTSSGVAMRATGPMSQLDCSGPRNGLVKSAALAVRAGAEPQPSIPASARDVAPRTRRTRTGLHVMAEQIKKFLPDLFLMEDAAQRRGDRQRPGLLHAAHFDAEVPRLDDHHGPQRIELLFETGDYLLGQPLLELRPFRVELQDAGELGQADDAFARDVGDMGMAVEGDEMMGAHGVEGNLLLHHHVAVPFVVRERGDLGLRPLGQPVEHLDVHLGD